MSKEIADWQKALADQAKQIKEAEKTGGAYGFISLKGGRMTYQEQEIPNSELECITVGYITERTMYDRAYDPDDTGPPDCFAQGLDPKKLKPHPNVPNPIADKCVGCPKAEFGTARVGKGPACKTYKKLMVMPANCGTTPEQVAAGEMAIIRIPPTSVANWSKYAETMGTQGLPPWAVRTFIKSKPHPKKMFEVTFKAAAKLDDGAVLAAIHGRTEEAERALMRPYEYEPEEKF